MDADRFDALVAAFFAVPTRRDALRVLAGLGLAGLLDQADAKKKKKRRKKKCAKAGKKTSKKRKKCCKGLTRDATKRCVGTCTPGSCPANQICLLSGDCQPCTVTCTGTPAECGDALQAAMDGGGTVYACPGNYRGGFILNTAVRLIGAGEGSDAGSNTILDANNDVDVGRVLRIFNDVGTVELERLRITGGNPGAGVGAAGILHGNTTLVMTECTVSGNTTVDNSAAGIGSNGTLAMTRCTVRDNHATGFGIEEGGGIRTGGTTTLTDCLVAENSASLFGGGILSTGTTILAGSTEVRDNAAPIGGGIMVNSGTLIVAETCRVTENSADPGDGGGIRNAVGTVTLAGPDPSLIVVNNCHENCVGNVPKCAATPVSCPP